MGTILFNLLLLLLIILLQSVIQWFKDYLKFKRTVEEILDDDKLKRKNPKILS